MCHCEERSDVAISTALGLTNFHEIATPKKIRLANFSGSQ